MQPLYLATLIVILSAENTLAYVGPGLGLGAVGTFFGIVMATLLGIFGLIWYPLKRLAKRLRTKKNYMGQKTDQ